MIISLKCVQEMFSNYILLYPFIIVKIYIYSLVMKHIIPVLIISTTETFYTVIWKQCLERTDLEINECVKYNYWHFNRNMCTSTHSCICPISPGCELPLVFILGYCLSMLCSNELNKCSA